jgi:hypothetical protein
MEERVRVTIRIRGLRVLEVDFTPQQLDQLIRECELEERFRLGGTIMAATADGRTLPVQPRAVLEINGTPTGPRR